ncbi:molybdate transport system substrate-binding protein [Persephonella hydrogeniphila]|uniref:Molybdate transport system substrate-binding protein n=1 Tax=Persephonella hydrogeniphila TaxID=198703 RepID=A0A285NR13_9AQUI|nr:molybdate ABC transporter substrate-binding protein [Persephonella hydrogeniphila]SNZ10061.1 molybdate transport system substrate-binding protein [Persephonella hydrogeniphila]
MKVLLTVFFIFFSFSYGETLRIAAAANVQYALQDIISSFRKKFPQVEIIISVSSSGKLTAQIERGAPFDIFLSANMKYPEYLYKKGLALGKPVVYAKGVLVLWSMKNIPLKEKDIFVLEEDTVKKIAIPNPRNAPYGEEAVKALKFYRLYRKVKNKLVYGESVSQATQYIYKKLVDAGFCSKSVVLSPKMRGKGVWIEVDRKAYSPIKQGAVILSKNIYAKEFLRFLLSDEGKKILKKYGYIIR